MAETILIALVVVVCVALAGWVFGLSKSYTESGAITILPSESSCDTSGCRIVVSNQGERPVSVVSAWVNGQSVAAYSVIPVTQLGPNAVPAHSQATVVFGLQGAYSGQSVEIRLGLSNGNTISTVLTVSG